MKSQLPSSSRQPLPCTSISIGVPMGPLVAPTTFAVMSRSNAVCVSRRSPCCTTTSCRKPKSSGATNVAAIRPAASLLTVAIRYAVGVNSRPKYSAMVTFQEPFTVRQTSSSSCPGGKFSPVTVSGVPTGPCAGETFRCPTYPFDGSVNATSAPSSLARGAASALSLDANKTVNNMQASPQARPPSMRIVMTVASALLLDLDLAVENRELRRLHLERLPGMRVALHVGRGHFVCKSAGGIVLGDDPRRGPEIVGGLPRGMATEARVELLPVRQLDRDALQPLVIELLAGLVVDAEAPDHLFEMLELVVEHAGWRNARLIAAFKVP